jgi:general secretion pathway protein C
LRPTSQALANQPLALRFSPGFSRLRNLADRHGPTLASVLLVLLAAFLLATWTWKLFGNKSIVRPSQTTQLDAGSAADSAIAAHLFGVPAERQTQETSQVSNLNIQLKGVFAENGNYPAYAIVNTGAKDEPVKTGNDIMPGVVLDSVKPEHILVKRNGVLERVNLEERPGGGGGGSTGPGLAPARPGAPAQRTGPSQFRLNVPQTAPNTFNFSRSELGAALQDPRQVANLGRVSPHQGGGVSVDEVPPGSLAERLGLQQGDVIRAVNGKQLASPADFAQIYQQQGQSGQIKVEGLRGGRPLNLNYNVQQ